ncbi:MAG: PilZ domain-containing protein [Bdellovibrionales bacterium]
MTVVGYFLMPTVRRLYFDPRLRWWETQPRYKTDFQCQVERGGGRYWVEIRNISEGGAFLQTSEIFSAGENLKIFFKDSQGVIALAGEVVYRRMMEPAGYGFKFDKPSTKEPRLKALIRKLEEQGALIRSPMPATEESFVSWLKSILESVKKKSA